MANIFSGLISDSFKQLHEDMISAMLEDDSCTVPCMINYRSTKFDDCLNCKIDPIGGKSSNRFQSGGPVPFYHGVCPVCNGAGKIQVTSTDSISLLPIWDSKQWYKLSQDQINTSKIEVQTMSLMSTYSKLTRATSINIDTDIKNYGVPEFIRVGKPEPCGLGQSSFIITNWRRK